jgi:hypothetical protein
MTDNEAPTPATQQHSHGRQRAEKIAGALGLLVLGALIQPLGTLIVQHFADSSPKQATQPVFVARQNDSNYNFVFPKRPDRDAILTRIKSCSHAEMPSETEAKLIIQSQAGCQADTILEAGGFPPFGEAQVIISNPTGQPIVITDIRSVTDAVQPTEYAEFWSNPAGGETGDNLAFNLDAKTAPALLQGLNEPIEKTFRANRRPYFDTKTITIEPNRSESLFITAHGTKKAIYKWHLEVTLTHVDNSDKPEGKPEAYRVSPPSGEFVAASGIPLNLPLFTYVEHMQ